MHLFIEDLKSPKNFDDVSELIAHHVVASQENWQRVNLGLRV
jgi:hypothetical protein